MVSRGIGWRGVKPLYSMIFSPDAQDIVRQTLVIVANSAGLRKDA